MAKRKRGGKGRGLSGSPAEHEGHARDNALTADESLIKAEKALRKGDCEETLLQLETTNRFLGQAEAHYDEASRVQGMVRSDRVKRLERTLYHPDSGLSDNVRRVRRNFFHACVVKK